MQLGDILDPATLVGERWFASPGLPIIAITVEERFELGEGALVALRVDVDGGAVLRRTMPVEAPDGREPWVSLYALATQGGSIAGRAGSRISGRRRAGPPPQTPLPSRSVPDVRPLGRDQSHTSVVVDDAIVLKLYRSLAAGVNPEVELGAALADDPRAPVPGFRGALTLQLGGRRHALAFLQDLVPDAGDAFEELAERLAAWLRAGAPQRALASLIADGEPAGRAIAGLHASLAGLRGAAFTARPVHPRDVDAWRRRADLGHRHAIRLLRSADPALAAWLDRRGQDIDAAFDGYHPTGMLQRIHADFHLGQLLRVGSGFLIGDLEGEPTRAAGERRRHDTPLRDLASMLRSFDHVARSGMRRSGVPLDQIAAGSSAADPAIDAWIAAIRRAFLEAYEAASMARGQVVAIDRPTLRALEVEKELYEFGYAATYVPAWMYAPAAGMRWLLDARPD